MLYKARKQSRKAIESLYDSTCNIKAYGKYKDPITKETKVGLNPVAKYSNQPCKISKKSLSKNNKKEVNNIIAYELKLFISPEVDVKQGDVIEVNRLGSIEVYKAGEGFPYSSHKEIILIKEGNA